MNNKVPLTTDTFRISPAVYLRVTAGAMLPSLTVAIILIALLATLAGIIIDLRILLVGLILLFLILPFVIGHIYYSRLLTPQARYAVAPKHLIFHPDGSIDEIPDSADPENTPAIAPRHFPADTIKNRKVIGKYAIVEFFNTPGYQLIFPCAIATNPADNND